MSKEVAHTISPKYVVPGEHAVDGAQGSMTSGYAESTGPVEEKVTAEDLKAGLERNRPNSNRTSLGDERYGIF